MENSIKIRKKTIGDDSPVFVIAEMAWSHDGSIEKAKKIIKGAAEAGADAINFHITSLKDYMVKDYGSAAGQTISAGKKVISIYEYLDKINIKNRVWEKLFAFAKKPGLIISAMPNDIQSIRLCKKLNPDVYTIAAACFAEEDFIIEIAKDRKPVVLRIGGASLGEIENTINLIKRHGTKEIILLHGIQLYPTKIEDTYLRLIPSLKKIFGLPVGLADHIDAESSLAMIIPLLSIPLGAKVIEKHLTHDRNLKGEDFEAALSPDEFKNFVSYIRETEKSLGASYFRDFSPAELKYRRVSRKKAVAARDIKIKEKIKKEDIIFKRADDGLCPDEIRFIIGRMAKQNINKDEPVTLDKIL